MRITASTSTAAIRATAANAFHKPSNPICSNTVGVTTAAIVDPMHPQMPHMPIAVPILSALTHF